MTALAGKVALVAGGTRGAGRGIAVELGAAGAHVYVTGRTTRQHQSEYRRPETIEETADLVREAGGTATAISWRGPLARRCALAARLPVAWDAGSSLAGSGSSSSGPPGPVACHTSLTTIWSAPAAGMEISAATKLPKKPPTQSPIEAPTRTDTRISSGLTFTVRLMITGFRTWFSICW